MRCLYAVSDFLFPLMYYVVRYRRSVVRRNLCNSFPEKALSEIVAIEKKFYRYFCDITLETFKQMNMGADEMKKRMTFGNLDLLHQHAKEGRSVMLMTAHYGNWEWTSILGKIFDAPYQVYPIYQKLKNKHFNDLIFRIRSRYGSVNIERNDLLRTMVAMRQKGVHGIFEMISDQSPQLQHIQYRLPFLNQQTPVFLGTEKIAKKFDYPVYYLHLKRLKRGYYHAEVELISLYPRATADYEITNQFMCKLERSILENPEYWMWSHNRWKHA